MVYTISDLLKVIEDEIVKLLEDNITDPISKRTGCKFVDHGRERFDGKTPRILVKRGRSNRANYNNVGNGKQDIDVVYNILIEIAPSAGGMYKGEHKTGTELLNLLSGQVAQVMEDNFLPYVNNTDSVIKQIKRESLGEYEWNPVTNVHYNIQQYNIYAVNE